jgi:hypothetical protein
MKVTINEEISRIKNIMGLLYEARLEDIVQKYVGEGKPVSEEKYAEIENVSNGDKNYIMWLIIRIANEVIKDEDVYKYEDYFKIFTKYKNLFPVKDINQIKTYGDVQDFIKKCVEIREKDVTSDIKTDEFNKDNYVSVGDIQKLSEVGIKYYGMADGYQVFEVPNEAKDNPEAKKRYREILGRCAGRDKGAKISICTMSAGNYFESYLTNFPDSSYFVMFNLGDKNSPYQFHYESGQFMDKNDTDVIRNSNES